MSDRDRLAALLHEGPAGDLHRDPYETQPCSFCEDEADRLIAAGVQVDNPHTSIDVERLARALWRHQQDYSDGHVCDPRLSCEVDIAAAYEADR